MLAHCLRRRPNIKTTLGHSVEAAHLSLLFFRRQMAAVGEHLGRWACQRYCPPSHMFGILLRDVSRLSLSFWY